MAIIRKNLLDIGGTSYSVEVHYNSKSGYFYYKGLPGDFCTLSGFRNMATTENNLYTDFKSCTDVYLSAVSQKRLVIAFKSAAASQLIGEPVEGGGWHLREDKFKKMFHGSVGVGLDVFFGFTFKVLTEVDKNGSKVFFEHKCTGMQVAEEHSKFPTSVGNDYTVLEYSEAVHAFLLRMTEAFRSMVHSIAGFFGETDQIKIELMASNLKLLLD